MLADTLGHGKLILRCKTIQESHPGCSRQQCARPVNLFQNTCQFKIFVRIPQMSQNACDSSRPHAAVFLVLELVS